MRPFLLVLSRAILQPSGMSWVLPTVFARVARGDMTPEEGAKALGAEYKRIFARWQ